MIPYVTFFLICHLIYVFIIFSVEIEYVILGKNKIIIMIPNVIQQFQINSCLLAVNINIFKNE